MATVSAIGNPVKAVDFTAIKTACIVGAGVAGLTTAKTLQDAGVTCTVFERGKQIGGVWTDGYLDFGVQVQKELYEFPDFPLPEKTPQFTPGPLFQEYLERYVDHFGIRDSIRLGVTVEEVLPATKRNGWQVICSNGKTLSTEKFDLVVICVGLFSNVPYVPDFPGMPDFKGETLHISGLKSADILNCKRVAVVGFGKSATDAALAAKEHAKAAHIIVRELRWPIPTKLAGILPFKWGLLNRLTSTLLPLYKTPSALEQRIHTLGKPLVWFYWRVVELLFVIQCQLWSQLGTRQSLVPDDPVEIGAFSEATMLPRPDFYKWVRKGEITFHKGVIERFLPNGVRLNNGSMIDVDTIIFGTGWRSDYRFLSRDLQERLGFADDGIYLYRQILHPELPSLVFIGYASAVSNTVTYNVQARWLSALITGHHKLPEPSEQLKEINLLRKWKREWMPFSHARAARLIGHMQHYLDELVSDIGANPLRKKGAFAPLAEVFAPYQPSDYRNIAAKDWVEREGIDRA